MSGELINQNELNKVSYILAYNVAGIALYLHQAIMKPHKLLMFPRNGEISFLKGFESSLHEEKEGRGEGGGGRRERKGWEEREREGWGEGGMG